MIPKEDLDSIQKETRALLEMLDVGGVDHIEVKEEVATEEGPLSVFISVTVQEPQVLIGERGQTLIEIQHILKGIIRKKINIPVYINLDINDYKKSRERYIRELARDAADEVTLLKEPKELPPMPAAERRIVHMELAERNDITSDSEGEGEERKIVIRPKK